ncbi:MAG: hypothetical protein A3B08_02010 [Candidatus Taylorbacteria bacterium RIFCSPLOWO2_01_FULL_43_44]|nr:MAG: hypothetical protein A3B08_02010 [Candidatus Taylorbacteria bacterium RIFCSPLOWO2_01_FULL_43_44]
MKLYLELKIKNLAFAGMLLLFMFVLHNDAHAATLTRPVRGKTPEATAAPLVRASNGTRPANNLGLAPLEPILCTTPI